MIDVSTFLTCILDDVQDARRTVGGENRVRDPYYVSGVGQMPDVKEAQRIPPGR